MSVDHLICHQCGAKLTAKRQKPIVVRQGFGLGAPLFCSTKCAHVYDEANLTLSKLAGLSAQLQCSR